MVDICDGCWCDIPDSDPGFGLRGSPTFCPICAAHEPEEEADPTANWSYYDERNGISVAPSLSSELRPIEVVLPSMVFLTPNEALSFGKALIAAANATKGQQRD